jgi:hypothetical protein
MFGLFLDSHIEGFNNKKFLIEGVRNKKIQFYLIDDQNANNVKYVVK